MQSYAALTSLAAAIAFSWPSAAEIFISDNDAVIPVRMTTMIASAVNLFCISLAFSVAGPCMGTLIMASSVVVGTTIRAFPAGLSTSLSVVFLSYYLQSY